MNLISIVVSVFRFLDGFKVQTPASFKARVHFGSSPKSDRGRDGAYSGFDSEVPECAATTAGAITIPMKASAMSRSCI